jgi:hypothetical protein
MLGWKECYQCLADWIDSLVCVCFVDYSPNRRCRCPCAMLRRKLSIVRSLYRGTSGQLTMPSPIVEILCESLVISGRPRNLNGFSSEIAEVGELCCISDDEFVYVNLRQTNFSKSCSSLYSRSPMWSGQTPSSAADFRLSRLSVLLESLKLLRVELVTVFLFLPINQS